MEVKMSWKSLQFLSLYMFIFLSEYMKTGFGVSLMNIKCIERERQALLKIKHAFIGGNLLLWSKNDYYCCVWPGVSCSKQTGHVVSLDLTSLPVPLRLHYKENTTIDMRLKGNLSASLLELQHLNYLSLSSVDFGGQQIPEFIGSLNKLEHLDLSNANFSGRIPYQLGNLSRLRYLDLSSDFGTYTAKLEWLSHMSSLKHLNLSAVNLSEATDWLQVISGLSSLTDLQLRDCNLPTVISSSISFVNSSNSLGFLDLSGNNLSNSVYLWLFHYSSNLVQLYLDDSNLHGSIPDAFCNMNSLMSLNLSANQIDGVPKCFSNMCALEELFLDSNEITGQLSVLLFSLSGCVTDSLEVLSLYDNSISGQLPDFTPFLSMKRLDIGKNQLNGTISKSIGQLYKLEYLDLSLNSLHGIITEAHISSLFRLQYIDLSFNSLTLNFSSAWTPRFQLLQIALAGCKQGPHFPQWLQNQHSVSYLDISNAGISGTIPAWFYDLHMYQLNLSNNQLSGILPDLSFTAHNGIDLSSNYFEGPIPPVSYVTSLLLSKNKFSGSISFLCGITEDKLVYLDLSDNQLSGDIPDCFMRSQNLEVLNLANNNFSGKVPDMMKSNCRIWALDLHNNNFTGELPSSLKNCKELTIIDMGNNKLFGTIPAWIGDIPNLTILGLRSNQFHGNIPIQLCELTKVQILDFSQNNISGTIPKCLNNLTAMVQKESSSATIEHTITTSVDGDISYLYLYQGHIFLIWKGTYSEYKSTVGLVKSIDFAGNKLSGNIPKEITNLVGLVSLNLSRNSLVGSIPTEIGKLKLLNSLDLSNNLLNGEIPESFSQLDSLGVLNLSNNNLSGEIPSSTKPQSFSASSYMGNPDLCGTPLPNKCQGDDQPPPDPDITISDNEDGLITPGFYVSMVLGIIVGFWGVCGTLLMKKSWRYAYFQFFSDMKDKLYILVAVNKAKLQRKLRN